MMIISIIIDSLPKFCIWKVLDKIQGFGESEKTEDEDSNLPPALAQIVDKIQDHENK